MGLLIGNRQVFDPMWDDCELAGLELDVAIAEPDLQAPLDN